MSLFLLMEKYLTRWSIDAMQSLRFYWEVWLRGPRLWRCPVCLHLIAMPYVRKVVFLVVMEHRHAIAIRRIPV